MLNLIISLYHMMAPSLLADMTLLVTIISIIVPLTAQDPNQCEFKCPNKDQTPWHPKDFEFTTNGCGSMGLKVQLDPRIEGCCDTHDACYSGSNLFQ